MKGQGTVSERGGTKSGRQLLGMFRRRFARQ